MNRRQKRMIKKILRNAPKEVPTFLSNVDGSPITETEAVAFARYMINAQLWADEDRLPCTSEAEKLLQDFLLEKASSDSLNSDEERVLYELIQKEADFLEVNVHPLLQEVLELN